MATKINWTDETWNPIIGCSKISIGCDNCYGEKMAHRLANINTTSYYLHVVKGSNYGTPMAQTYPKWNGRTHFVESQLEKPGKWKKPRKIFVCSMSDLFHEDNSFDDILRVWDVMCENPRHIFQVLTKRPERMLEFYKWLGARCKNDGLDSVPSSSPDPLDYISTPDHIWIGVTTENQEMANKRIPVLFEVPAKTRFVSCEPLLGAIDFSEIRAGVGLTYHALKGEALSLGEKYYDGPKISQLIVGGESGPKARPMHPYWVRSLRSQCESAGVPFFFKQWGEWHESDLQENKGWKTHLWPDGKLMYKMGKKKAGELLDGIEYKEFPK